MPVPEILFDNLLNDCPPVVYVTSDHYVMPSCHIHNHNELMLLVSGKVRFENNLKITEVEGPAVIIHNSYTLHRSELLEGQYKRYLINFYDKTLDKISGLSDTVRFFKSANMTVIRLTEEMRDVLEGYVRRYPEMSREDGSQDALTCLILYEIAKYRSKENTVGIRAKIPYINDVMCYITEHYSEPITMEELTARFYISRAKLAADFSETTGMTVKQYTTLVRMNVARGMIQDGATVSDAARACGYSNVSNFSAVFSKMFGENPAKFKTTEASH